MLFFRCSGHFTAFLASNKPEPVESKDRAVHRPPPAVEAADSRPQDPDDEIVMTICDGQSYFTPTSTVELVNAKPVRAYLADTFSVFSTLNAINVPWCKAS